MRELVNVQQFAPKITLLSRIHVRFLFSFSIKLLIRLGLALPSLSNIVGMAYSVRLTLLSYTIDLPREGEINIRVMLFVSIHQASPPWTLSVSRCHKPMESTFQERATSIPFYAVQGSQSIMFKHQLNTPNTRYSLLTIAILTYIKIDMVFKIYTLYKYN